MNIKVIGFFAACMLLIVSVTGGGGSSGAVNTENNNVPLQTPEQETQEEQGQEQTQQEEMSQTEYITQIPSSYFRSAVNRGRVITTFRNNLMPYIESKYSTYGVRYYPAETTQYLEKVVWKKDKVFSKAAKLFLSEGCRLLLTRAKLHTSTMRQSRCEL